MSCRLLGKMLPAFLAAALVAGVAALGAATAPAPDQDKPKPATPPAAQPPQPSPADQAAMQDYMKLMSPGDNHKKLEPFIGKWNTAVKVFMAGPGSPPMESSGVAERKWIFGGRYILEEYKGQMMGMPHEGLGLTGYDNYRNMYVGSWVDNMGTTILTMKGMCDPGGKVFTYYGEMDEPPMKVAGRTVKYVTRIVDADTHVFEIIDLHAGDNYKVIEITYKRAK